MKLKVNGGASIEVSSDLFECDYNEGLIHQLITAQLAGARQGTKAQKTRADVRGGGAKPWKQKGTGRARASTIRSPLWRGGGITFAARPRNFEQKLNKKMYKKGMKVILSELVRQDRFMVTDTIDLPAPKTKALAGYLKNLGLNDVLIVSDSENLNLDLASRNLPRTAVCVYTKINPVNLLSFEKVLFTVDALKKLENQFSDASST
ncbi:MAG TPA: 50S ribosomal protein L4 [Coxiellaceae bacterium]|nr:50S ribosomal protein L4 [Coxiellaceae bacterium]